MSTLMKITLAICLCFWLWFTASFLQVVLYLPLASWNFFTMFIS